MMPGISASPPASTISAPSLPISPTAAMRPFRIATSARIGSFPSPSRTVAPRITRSFVAISLFLLKELPLYAAPAPTLKLPEIGPFLDRARSGPFLRWVARGFIRGPHSFELAARSLNHVHRTLRGTSPAARPGGTLRRQGIDAARAQDHRA